MSDYTYTCTTGMFNRRTLLCAASCVTKNISPRLVLAYDFLSRCKYAEAVFEIVHEESFLHAEPVKPPPPLRLRLPAAVAELAVYVFREHHVGAVLLFSVRTPIFSQIRYYCCSPNTNTTKRNIRHISDRSKCTVFYTPELKLMQDTRYRLEAR